MSWSNASEYCLKHSAGLVVVDEDDEFDFIAYNVSDAKSGFHVGFRYFNRSWRWLGDMELQQFKYFTINDLCERTLPIRKREQLCGRLEREKRGKLCLTAARCDSRSDFICEKVTDYCTKYRPCSKDATCIPDQHLKYSCKCTSFWTGSDCDKVSSRWIQLVIASVMVTTALLGPTLLKILSDFKQRRFERTIQCAECNQRRKMCEQVNQSHYVRTTWMRTARTTGVVKSDHRNYSVTNYRAANLRTPSNPFESIYSHISDVKSTSKYTVSKEPFQDPHKKRHMLRRFAPSGHALITTAVTCLLTVLMILFTVVLHLKQFRQSYAGGNQHPNTSKDTDMPVNDPGTQLHRCRLVRDYRWQNIMFLPVSMLFTIAYGFAKAGEKRVGGGKTRFWPGTLFRRHRNRYTACAVFGVMTNEILAIVEETMFSVNLQQDEDGILVCLLRKISLVFAIGMRRCPQLLVLLGGSSFSHQQPCLYLIGFLYSLIDMFMYAIMMAICPLPSWLQKSSRLSFRITKTTMMETVTILPTSLLQFLFSSFIVIKFLMEFQMNISKSRKPEMSDSFEWHYTKKLFRRTISRNQVLTPLKGYPQWCTLHRRLFENPFDTEKTSSPLFSFSTHVMSMYTIAFTLVVNLTTRICIYSSVTGTALMSGLEATVPTVVSLASNSFRMRNYQYNRLHICCLLALLLYTVQLAMGLFRMKHHLLAAYKGSYVDIPPMSNFSPAEIVEKALHFPGYLVCYTSCGFLILFQASMLVVGISQHWFSLDVNWTNKVFSYVAPLLLLYAVKRCILTMLTKFVFMDCKRLDDVALHRPCFYQVFIYFNFIFDCFLGMLSCMGRLMKSVIIALLYMSRLDYSFMGRNLERLDRSFAAYVAYIHLEVQHGHPVLVTFIELVARQLDDSNGQHAFKMKVKGYANVCQMSAFKQRCKFRWFLAYTLLRNPCLIHFRKHRLMGNKIGFKNSDLAAAVKLTEQSRRWRKRYTYNAFVRDLYFKYDFDRECNYTERRHPTYIIEPQTGFLLS